MGIDYLLWDRSAEAANFGTRSTIDLQLGWILTKVSLQYMYVIEILLNNTAMPLSVQRKTVEEAATVYQQVLAAMQSDDRTPLELSCDRQPEKKIAVMKNLIVATQMYEKSGAAASGKTPGFVTFTES